MRYLILLTLLIMLPLEKTIAQLPSTKAVKNAELQLEDVMEIIDTIVLKQKVQVVEQAYQNDPNTLNQLRKGIIYHEMALNFSFLKNRITEHNYAQESFDLLTSLLDSTTVVPEFIPFATAYQASALALVSAKTNNLKQLNKAFKLFQVAVQKYSALSYVSEFMRGSVAENLPWFLFRKRKHAKQDFTAIIAKYEQNPSFANDKIMSFTYWAWANQH